MYMKILKNTVKFRISDVDLQFLQSLSIERSITISDLLRSIVLEYKFELENKSNGNK